MKVGSDILPYLQVAMLCYLMLGWNCADKNLCGAPVACCERCSWRPTSCGLCLITSAFCSCEIVLMKLAGHHASPAVGAAQALCLLWAVLYHLKVR